MASEESENTDVADSFEIPLGFKILVIILTAPIILSVIYFYWAYICDPINYPSPGNLGLPAILIFSITVLLSTFIPWNKLRAVFKKIGPIELQDILNTQATERDQDIHEVEERLTTMEDQVFNRDEGTFITESFYGPELRKLLKEFLRKNDPVAFSPLRIKKWGAKQEGFEEFRKFELAHIRIVLREFVSEGFLTTVVSKKGNTLYKLLEY